MAVKPKPRIILEHIAESTVDSNYSPIKYLAISRLQEDQALIYVATLSGVLLLYSLRTYQGAPAQISFVRRASLPGIGSGSSVSSIHMLVGIGKIVVVSDGFLFLLDSDLLEPAKKLSLFKGVTAFSRRFRSQRYVSTGYSNGGGETNYLGTHDSDTDIGNLFAIGVGKKLLLARLILSGSLVIQKDIQGVLDGIVVALLWIDDSIFVGTKTGYYLYNCANGHCGLIFSLPDSSSIPRLKLLAKESTVLLMIDNVGIIVDVEGHPVGGSLVFKEAPDTIKEIGSCVLAARGSLVELYHKKTGCWVQRIVVGDGSGVPCLLADEENESGKVVAIATGLKMAICYHESTISDLKLICYGKVSEEEQIKDLLRKKYFREAISLVEELKNEGDMTKEMLSFVHAQVGFLLLFDLQFQEAVDHFLLSENMQPSEVFPFILRDPNRWTLLVPRNRYWGLHPPPKLLENVIDDGLIAIQRAAFLKKAGVEITITDEFLLNPPSRGDLLESAIENMIRYLQACRERDLLVSVKEGVDTLLMYLYRALNRVEDMERLASLENSCVVEELEALLSDSGHLRTLAFLYACKGLSAKALSIWRILARNYSSNNCDKDQLGEAGFKDPSRKVASRREAAAIEASKILMESSDQDLILQHLGWIADINQVLAVQILISEERTKILSPDEVIAAMDPKKPEILQRYLQWLIEDQHSDESRFHTAYSLLLAKSALAAYESEISSEHPMDRLPENEMKLTESSVRGRLQIFLQSSDLYDVEEVLYMIEESELWLEKAILYRRLGQENLVLQILALKLENFEAAEQYCVEIGRPDAYIQLFDMYLDPKDGRAPMLNDAVRLLHKHGEMLDPVHVLERLSPNLPLQLASDTIVRMLRARHHHHHQGKILHNVSRALDVDARLARLEERSRYAQITDESVCDCCHARLGTKLFAMYPDDTIACYKCYRRQGESTSVSGRNFKRDVLIKPGWLVTR